MVSSVVEFTLLKKATYIRHFWGNFWGFCHKLRKYLKRTFLERREGAFFFSFIPLENLFAVITERRFKDFDKRVIGLLSNVCDKGF